MDVQPYTHISCGSVSFQLRRSKRKTLAVTVRPDLSVIVVAPLKASLESVRAKVRKRTSWIRRQQQYFREFLPQTPPRRYLSGETHRYLGRQYRLKVIGADRSDVKLHGRFICVQSPRKGRDEIRKLLEQWYLKHAKDRLARSFTEGVTKLGSRLANPPRMRVRKMQKRWGSWTRRGGVSLNPELIKVPASCIDYVVVHELCHAVHGNHGSRFYELLKRVMPGWRAAKARLERAGSF